MSCVAHRLHMSGSNWNSSDFPSSRSARPPVCLSLEYNLQCSLLVPHLFPPHHRMFRLFALSKSSVHTGNWLWLQSNQSIWNIYISKEPISKTSRFWMFWYKRGCDWLGAIKGMALWSSGFSRGPLSKTWPKPETAQEKLLAPRVSENWIQNSFLRHLFSPMTPKKQNLHGFGWY